MRAVCQKALLCVLIATSWLGCEGTAQSRLGSEGDAPPADPPPSGSTPKPGVPSPGVPGQPPSDQEGPQAGPLPLRLLTQAEYVYSIEDVLGIDVQELVETFPSEITGDTGQATVGSLSSLHVERYQGAAEAIATMAIEEAIALVPGCAMVQDQGCVEAFVATLGSRLFRRPLSQLEAQEYGDLYKLAQTKELGLGAKGGLGLVLGAMLQAPFFLYHWERAEPLDLTSSGPQAIAPWQLASRLSYFLWQSLPDQELLEAAASGELLSERGFESQARRMVAHQKARRALPMLFAQLFDLPKILTMPKNPGLFGDFDTATRASMLESALLFFEHTMFGPEGHYTAMLNSPVAFVDRPMAAIYGLDPSRFSDKKWESQELDGGQRAGLLTLPAMLAVHADASEGNPIFRGVSFQQQVLCAEIPPPTGDVPPLPTGEGGKTLRERVTFHTAPPACAGCHALINPPGFAFGHYDALGRWQQTEGGEPIVTEGELVLPGDASATAFDGAVELAKAIAAHPAPYTCLAKRLGRYAYGRQFVPADRQGMEAVQQAFRESGYDLKELFVLLAMSPSFRLVHFPVASD